MDVKAKSTGSKKRWKPLIVIFIIAAVVVLIGFIFCVWIGPIDYTLPPSPDSFGNAKWMSESSDVWFEVNGEEDHLWQGKLTVEGKTYSCKVCTAYHSIYFWQGEANTFRECKRKDMLLEGFYQYVPNKRRGNESYADAPEKMVIDVHSDSHFFSDERLELIRCP